MLVPIPELSDARRVLAVQPHYDDNDIGAGGTLAALASAGAEVYYLTVTDDLVGVHDQTLGPEESRRLLKSEQARAAEEIGVRGQYWLELPDAGEYDYFDVRRGVIRHIRMLRPDFVFTVDPWMPNEAHRDHVVTGRAVAEACLLHGHARIPSGDAEVDAAYERYGLSGVAFYFTARPNTVFDITKTRERKHHALDAYRAQFTEQGLAVLHAGIGHKEKVWAEGESFDYGEALKVLSPSHLHVNPDAEEMG